MSIHLLTHLLTQNICSKTSKKSFVKFVHLKHTPYFCHWFSVIINKWVVYKDESPGLIDKRLPSSLCGHNALGGLGEGKMLTIKTCWDKALLALCPWRLETSHISILESRRSDERCSWVKHRINYTYVGRYSFFAIRKQCELCVFSFYSKRQCEGLQTWNKWKTQTHTFFPIQTSLTDTRIDTLISLKVKIYRLI